MLATAGYDLDSPAQGGYVGYVISGPRIQGSDNVLMSIGWRISFFLFLSSNRLGFAFQPVSASVEPLSK